MVQRRSCWKGSGWKSQCVLSACDVTDTARTWCLWVSPQRQQRSPISHAGHRRGHEETVHQRVTGPGSLQWCPCGPTSICWFPVPVVQLLWAWVLRVGSFSMRFWDSLPRSSVGSGLRPNPVTQQHLLVPTKMDSLPLFLDLWLGPVLCFPRNGLYLASVNSLPPNLACPTTQNTRLPPGDLLRLDCSLWTGAQMSALFQPTWATQPLPFTTAPCHQVLFLTQSQFPVHLINLQQLFQAPCSSRSWKAVAEVLKGKSTFGINKQCSTRATRFVSLVCLVKKSTGKVKLYQNTTWQVLPLLWPRGVRWTT